MGSNGESRVLRETLYPFMIAPFLTEEDEIALTSPCSLS
jgi:hypothetical protein